MQFHGKERNIRNKTNGVRRENVQGRCKAFFIKLIDILKGAGGIFLPRYNPMHICKGKWS